MAEGEGRQDDGVAAEAAANPADAGTRCGFIGLIGAPNAGKSTLLNALVGTKISIVSRKVQTTRVPIRGIAMVGQSQLVFIDTPGIFVPRRRLDRAMVDAAGSVVADADVVVLMIDSLKGLDEGVEAILRRMTIVEEARRVLVLNKVDRVEKPVLLKLASEVNAKLPFSATFMISALSGSGVQALKAHLAKVVPTGPWHYPDDEITDASERKTAAEITREKIYEYLHQELPYQAAVETTAWEERKDGSVRIEQTIFVMRDTQRRIVLGEGGQAIKTISMASRRELSQIFERKVHLFLHVKVAEGWENDPERYREMGLDFPKA
ncbi:MAG: GTPase Era [Hyphomicrobiaceae bacterium]